MSNTGFFKKDCYINLIDRLLGYISFCLRDLSASVSLGMLLIFFVGTVLLLIFLSFKKGIRWSARLLLLENVFFLFSLAVLTRSIQTTRTFDMIPFWSYRTIRGGGHEMLLTQMIANVVAFIPMGLLFGITFPQLKWWQVLLMVGAFSLLIETSQFFFKRGFAEFDDVFHNVLGCVIGYGVYVALVYLVNRMKRSVTSNPH